MIRAFLAALAVAPLAALAAGPDPALLQMWTGEVQFAEIVHSQLPHTIDVKAPFWIAVAPTDRGLLVEGGIVGQPDDCKLWGSAYPGVGGDATPGALRLDVAIWGCEEKLAPFQRRYGNEELDSLALKGGAEAAVEFHIIQHHEKRPIVYRIKGTLKPVP
jgi:hypothetical protein